MRVARTETGAAITVDDRPFANYLTHSGTKPVVWPVLGPDQIPMTRAWPLDDSKPADSHDHPHQRSLWFSYGLVDGVDFWAETPGAGHIDHREFVELTSGPSGVVKTRNDWVAPDGRKLLEDERRLEFSAMGESRFIDFDIVLQAAGAAVHFGDTKEGAFGVRVAESLAVKNKQGGQIKNDAGLTDKAAWGQPARWVDYHGKIDDRPVGIALMNHPASFHFPTRWHVRDYGLFAANPFGARDFGADSPGGYTLPAGESIKLSYRVVLHRGDDETAGLAAAYEAYAAKKRP